MESRWSLLISILTDHSQSISLKPLVQICQRSIATAYVSNMQDVSSLRGAHLARVRRGATSPAVRFLWRSSDQPWPSWRAWRKWACGRCFLPKTCRRWIRDEFDQPLTRAVIGQIRSLAVLGQFTELVALDECVSAKSYLKSFAAFGD